MNTQDSMASEILKPANIGKEKYVQEKLKSQVHFPTRQIFAS